MPTPASLIKLWEDRAVKWESRANEFNTAPHHYTRLMCEADAYKLCADELKRQIKGKCLCRAENKGQCAFWDGEGGCLYPEEE